MEITKLEKAALITTGAAAAFKTLLWSLDLTIASTAPALPVMRAIFAALSFVAFDLVIVSVVMRGRSWSGAITIVVAAAVSALIALDVAAVWPDPALHAAPALTLAVFSLHLMLSSAPQVAALATESAATEPTAAPITQAVQVNVAAPAMLPRTVREFIAVRAAELPGYTQAQLAAELGTSADTVRRVLQPAATAIAESEA